MRCTVDNTVREWSHRELEWCLCGYHKVVTCVRERQPAHISAITRCLWLHIIVEHSLSCRLVVPNQSSFLTVVISLNIATTIVFNLAERVLYTEGKTDASKRLDGSSVWCEVYLHGQCTVLLWLIGEDSLTDYVAILAYHVSFSTCYVFTSTNLCNLLTDRVDAILTPNSYAMLVATIVIGGWAV